MNKIFEARTILCLDIIIKLIAPRRKSVPNDIQYKIKRENKERHTTQKETTKWSKK